jgi:hypothetical protein
MKRLLRLMLPLLVSAGIARAFPPAPHHVLYGTVRDEQGHPLRAGAAEVVLETTGGVVIRANTVDGAEPGVNFALVIPMDAGITGAPYRPTALNPRVPFRVRVRIGPSLFLPIQMRGDFAVLGRPGARTRIDLTLGEDADGDGLPDAWERILAGQAGLGSDLGAVDGAGDADGDGMSNLDEYLAGTYAFDPADGLALRLVRVDSEASVAEFLAVSGRVYEVQSSSDFATWTATPFRVGEAPASGQFRCSDTRVERIRIPAPADGSKPSAFFRVVAR